VLETQSAVVDKLSSVSRNFTLPGSILVETTAIHNAIKEGQDSIKHGAILRVLKPLSAGIRESEIARRHAETFNWMVEPHEQTAQGTDVRFIDWLKHDAGIFLVTGKPGSGKSTLMKFLVNDSRVQQSLKAWAAEGGKDLIFSKFFFWRLGSTDQKTVFGLLRGLLYDMCRADPRLVKLPFPKLWDKGYTGMETILGEADIRTAFGQIQTNEELHKQFSFCFFIDGLDEFDGQEMAHWKLARMLSDWTTGPWPIKLCLSSREEHSIVSEFQAFRQVRLQDLTGDDITAIINDTLLNNKFFQQLQNREPNDCSAFIESIRSGAEGVFLWTMIILNLVEDELPTASTVKSLQVIIETMPSRLEDFLGTILSTIKKHHRQHVYFLLAMVLRMLGFHLDDDGKSPIMEQMGYQKNFQNALGGTRTSYLPGYGISVALESIMQGAATGDFKVVLEALPGAFDYQLQSENAAAKIRTWCKGLVCVEFFEYGSFGDMFSYGFNDNRKLGLTTFFHRSIPEFLFTIIKEKAKEYCFNDEDIAQAILATLTAEIRAKHNHPRNIRTYFTHAISRTLRLLRLRSIPPSSRVFAELDKLEAAQLCEDQQNQQIEGSLWDMPWAQEIFSVSWEVYFVSDFPGGLGGVAARFDRNQNPSVLTLASAAGLHEYVSWKLGHANTDSGLLLSALCALVTVSLSPTEEVWEPMLAAQITILRTLLRAGANIGHFGWYTHLRNEPAFFEGSVRRWIFEDYPSDCFTRNSSTDPSRYSGLPSWWTWMVAVEPILENLLKPRGRCSQRLWDFLEIWLEAGAPPPHDISCEVVSELQPSNPLFLYRQWIVWTPQSAPETHTFFLEPHRTADMTDIVINDIRDSQPSKHEAINFQDLIAYHRPPNLDILLEYANRNILAILSNGSRAENQGLKRAAACQDLALWGQSW